MTDSDIGQIEKFIVRELGNLKVHIDGRLAEHERWLGENTRAIEKLTEGTVRQDRFESGMHKVQDLEIRFNQKVDKLEGHVGSLDDRVDALTVDRATMQQSLESYKKFMWLMVGSTVSLVFTLIAGLIMWVLTG